MGLLGKRKKDTDSKAPQKKSDTVSKKTFYKYFESVFSYQKQKPVQESAQLAQKDADTVNNGAVVFDDDEVETLRNPVFSVQHSGEIKDVPIVGISSVIGKRESQQDALAVSKVDVKGYFEEKWMAVLCDGMGGLNGGEKASQLCVNRMLTSFGSDEADIPSFYRKNTVAIDKEISSLTDADGNAFGAGSTLVSVVIDEDKLYWCSVGDSHIYIVRGSELVRVNTEHNYLNELLKLVDKGEITLEQAYSDRQKDALTSFMGIGEVSVMDIIEKPFTLQHGDIVLLCSDGLYRSLTDSEIFAVIQKNIMNMSDAANQLTIAALEKDYAYQDNTSVVIVKYQDKNLCNQ